MSEVIDWIGGLIAFALILIYAVLTAIKSKKRGQLATEYRTACAECGGEYQGGRDGLYCDDCGGTGDSP